MSFKEFINENWQYSFISEKYGEKIRNWAEVSPVTGEVKKAILEKMFSKNNYGL